MLLGVRLDSSFFIIFACGWIFQTTYNTSKGGSQIRTRFADRFALIFVQSVAVAGIFGKPTRIKCVQVSMTDLKGYLFQEG